MRENDQQTTLLQARRHEKCDGEFDIDGNSETIVKTEK
jgi:hypothetical protein